jgi:magnesium transporter
MEQIEKIEFKNFTWLNITKPDFVLMQNIAKEYRLHHLAIEDCLANIGQPKIDDYEDYLFMVFHLPRYIKKIKRTVPFELDIFLANNYIITIHNGELKPFNNLFELYSSGEKNLKNDSSAYLLYEILSVNFDNCFPMLEKVGQKLDIIEDKLYDAQSMKTLEYISLIAQDIINFRRVITPQRYFIRDLEGIKSKIIKENLDIYFDDIEDKIDRIWNTLDNYKEVCEVLQRTNESIMTQRLNEIMKLLTIFSVIMLPLTVITGFYGMNVVRLPFADHSFAPEIIIGILAVVVASMLYYFNRRKWL